jgi:hypothetical protein
MVPLVLGYFWEENAFSVFKVLKPIIEGVTGNLFTAHEHWKCKGGGEHFNAKKVIYIYIPYVQCNVLYILL